MMWNPMFNQRMAMMQQRFGRGGSPYGGRGGGMAGRSPQFGGMGRGGYGQRQPPWGGRFGQRGGEGMQRSLMPRGRLGDTGGTPSDFRGGSFDTGGLAGSLRGNYQDVDMEAVRDRLANVFQRGGGGFPQFGGMNDPVRGMEGFQRDGYGGRFAGMQRSPYGFGRGMGFNPMMAMMQRRFAGMQGPVMTSGGLRSEGLERLTRDAQPGMQQMPFAPAESDRMARGDVQEGPIQPKPMEQMPPANIVQPQMQAALAQQRQAQANKQMQPVANIVQPSIQAAMARYRQPQMQRMPQRPQMKTSFAQQLPMRRGGRTPGNFGPMNR